MDSLRLHVQGQQLGREGWWGRGYVPPRATADRGQECSIPGQLPASTESGKTGIQPLAPFDCTPITSADELLEKANVAEPEILKKKSPAFYD